MTPQEALSILTEVASKAVGTLADHQKIQEALSIVRSSSTPVEDPGD